MEFSLGIIFLAGEAFRIKGATPEPQITCLAPPATFRQQAHTLRADSQGSHPTRLWITAQQESHRWKSLETLEIVIVRKSDGGLSRVQQRRQKKFELSAAFSPERRVDIIATVWGAAAHNWWIQVHDHFFRRGKWRKRLDLWKAWFVKAWKS
jgi:hypothetical protein